MLRWDIFCKVVDNFGDIGVCWRLCRQLQVEHGLQIRLYVDNFDAASQIIQGLDKQQKAQIIQQVEIIIWQQNTAFEQDTQVVLETFSCGLPAQYLAKNPTVKWVNLEYLSAEKWVDDFHGKPSPQPNGMTRQFFYPGFTAKTGGLIREAHFFDRHSDESRNNADVLKISLFCYPSAPVHDLFKVLQANHTPVLIYVPESGILPKVAEFFGQKTLKVGQKLSQNNLNVEVLPFLSQAEYDILLQSCDINFVRGEDSWVRAIWAAQPFVWQPYFQTEDTHLVKLNAFLDLFYQDFGISKSLSIDGFETNNRPKQNLQDFHTTWANNQATSPQTWQQYLQDLPQIKRHTQQQAKKLANQPDLATQLVNFCNIN